MSKFQAELAVKMEAELGEGSIWDYRTSCLLWLDIMGATLFRYNPADGTNEAHSLKGFGVATVSSVVPLAAACNPSGDVVGCTTTDGFATYSFSAKTLTLLGGAPPVAAGERFNDGKLDPTGQYWAGTLVRDAAGEIVPSAGSFYKRDADGTVIKALAGVSISNGLAWTSDAKTMYYIDTPTQQVDAFDYDVATGSLSNRRAAVTGFTGGANGQVDGESSGYPDGCCIDAAGKLWVARFNGACAALYDPFDGGKKLAEAVLPPTAGIQVTSVALAGDSGDLYMTTGREGFDAATAAKYPLAGSLFVVKRATLEAAGVAAAAPAAPRTPGLKVVPAGSSRLGGKVIVVTGSSKGIGKGVAIRLAREGAKVVVNYRSDPAGAEAAVVECEAFSGKGNAVAIHGDLGKVADCEKLIEKAVAHFGTIDVLVNNAGMEIMADFWDVTEDQYDRVMDVNLKGPFFTTKAFVRHCKDRGKTGSIINMSSVHEDLPFPGFSPYCVSKGGMKMMTRNLSIELAPLGITINNVAPGAIETPINAAMLKQPEKLAELLSKIPLQRLGQPGDIGSCVVYLASEEATYVTGTTIVVDGGLTWNYVEKH